MSLPRSKIAYAERQGFSLVEILVVVTLLIVVSAAVTQIFAVILRSQKRIYADQQVQANLRYAVESLVHEVYQDSFDYAAYGSSMQSQQDTLKLLSSAGDSVWFKQNGHELQISRDRGNSWAPLLSGGVQVNSLWFYMAPTSDPYALCVGASCGTPPNQSPRVTVSMDVQSTSPYVSNIRPVLLQTTVTPRTYYR